MSFYGLDPLFVLSHVVWPDHEGGMPSLDAIDQAVAAVCAERLAA